MTPTLIVLGLLALGVGIVAVATRRSPYEQRKDQDAAWGEPARTDSEAFDPFAHAPMPQSLSEPAREAERQA